MVNVQAVNQAEFNKAFLEFLAASPTPYHATHMLGQALHAKGFERLHEGDAWKLEPGKRYWITRNDSTLIAFVYGKTSLIDSGIRLFGAHTDSPCLKVKPQPDLRRKGYWQLGVEVYGGALLAPWFDRDLSLAGRVTYLGDDAKIVSTLVDFKTPIATIPSLAIHLDREANNSRSINSQRDITPLLLQEKSQAQTTFKDWLKDKLSSLQPQLNIQQVLDFDLSFYDTQAPQLIGAEQDFIASARLDNLLSCFAGLAAISEADNQVSSLLICTDHEEVGSASCCGAKGPMLQQFLERLLPDTESRLRVIEKSLLISADNAHGVHPNFIDKHDENHGPLLNKGPVIKINANQRYATSSETSGIVYWLAQQLDVPLQAFVARTDMGCGSTIGPIVASEVGVKTLDIGCPTFAMHSIRELAGVADAHYLYLLTKGFFAYPLAFEFGIKQ